MSESLGSAVLDLSTDDSELEGGLDDAESTTRSKMGRIGGIVAKGAAATAAAFAAAGAAAVAAAAATAAYGDMLDKTSARIGVTTEGLQDLQFWASQNGIEAQRMDRIMERFTREVGRAAEGTGVAADRFEQLGVSLKDSEGGLRDNESVMRDTVASLKEIEDPSAQAAAAYDIFGRAALDLLPALRDGALSLEDATAAMDGIGRMSQDQIDTAVRFTDAWDELKLRMMSLVRDAAAPVMGFFADDLFPVLNDQVLPLLREVAEAFSEDGLAGAFEVLSDAFDGAGLLDMVRDVFSSILEFVTTNVGNIVDFLLESREAFFDAAITVFTALVEALPEIIPRIVEALLSMVTTIVETLVMAAPLILHGAIALVLGLVEGIVASLPMVIDAALQLIDTVLTTLVEMLPDLVDAGVELLLALVDGLVVAIPQLIALVVELIPMIVETVIELLPLLLDAGIQILLAVLAGMIEMAPEIIAMIATDLLPTLIATLIRAIPQLVEAGIDLLMGLHDGLVDTFSGALSDWFDDLPGNIADFFSDAGSWLVSAGKAILDGLWDGLKDKWADVSGWVGGLGGAIRDLKGPLPDDRVLLEDEGEAILQGLQRGLESQMRSLEMTLGGVTSTITQSIRAEDIVGGDGAAMAAGGGMHVDNLNVEATDGRFDLADIEDELAFRGAF